MTVSEQNTQDEVTNN